MGTEGMGPSPSIKISTEKHFEIFLTKKKRNKINGLNTLFVWNQSRFPMRTIPVRRDAQLIVTDLFLQIWRKKLLFVVICNPSHESHDVIVPRTKIANVQDFWE